jgi:hypothetical protein
VYASGVQHLAKIGAFVAATGRLSFRGGDDAGQTPGVTPSPELIVDEMVPLDMAVSRFAKRLRLRCDNTVGTEKLEALRDVLELHRGPCAVVLEQDTHEGLAILEVEQRVVLNQALFEGVEGVLGPHCWHIDAGNAPATIAPRRFERRAPAAE